MLFLIRIIVDGIHPQAAREAATRETARGKLEEEKSKLEKNLHELCQSKVV